MRLSDCFKKRLLRNIKPDMEKSHRSLEIALNKLGSAKTAFEKEFYDACIIYGYTSMFHSARAILYRDGIQEKSHVCIPLYLKEKYANKIPAHLIQSLDSFRTERHETLYGLDFEICKKDAELCIEDAKSFYDQIKKIISDN